MIDKKILILLRITTMGEVESAMTSLASRTHFEVLSLDLEAQGFRALSFKNSTSLQKFHVFGSRTALFFG